jgi:hypothetical protein
VARRSAPTSQTTDRSRQGSNVLAPLIRGCADPRVQWPLWPWYAIGEPAWAQGPGCHPLGG